MSGSTDLVPLADQVKALEAKADAKKLEIREFEKKATFSAVISIALTSGGIGLMAAFSSIPAVGPAVGLIGGIAACFGLLAMGHTVNSLMSVAHANDEIEYYLTHARALPARIAARALTHEAAQENSLKMSADPQRSGRLRESAEAKLAQAAGQRLRAGKPLPAPGDIFGLADPDAPGGARLQLRVIASGLRDMTGQSAEYYLVGRLHAACGAEQNPMAAPPLADVPEILVALPEPPLTLPRPLPAAPGRSAAAPAARS